MHNHPASFRDPSGHIFVEQGKLYRAIQPSYFAAFDRLERSGLYTELVDQKLLISHHLVSRRDTQIIIQPQVIPFVSYPCEWTFAALREAALLTLRINLIAMQHKMILKDASAYNLQFIGSRPIFIDTLSFEHYREGCPWYAFGQFCRHFIAPLLLIKYKSPQLSQIMSCFLDGIPLDLASSLLPFRTHFLPFIKLNIHMHFKKIQKASGGQGRVNLSQKSLLNIFNYTQSYLQGLTCPSYQTTWSDYREVMNYSPDSFQAKVNTVSEWLDTIGAKRIWDIGGNDGHFARHVSEGRELVINTDIDPVAIDRSFTKSEEQSKENILSLLVDLVNPTPAYGFVNKEREAFLARIKAAKLDCSLALAIVHHLCITHNCSFKMIAALLASVSPYLIIEFVARNDSWVSKMLDDMMDNARFFDFYNTDNFEQEFREYFDFVKVKKITNTHRTLYLMSARQIP